MSADQRSFAFDGVGGKWEWYEEDGLNVPIAEIRQHGDRIAAADGEHAARDFKALIAEKLKLAGRGQLQVPEDGRPHLFVAGGVMEIKWGLRGAQWRLYYCEPLHLHAARVMLALHFTQKIDLARQDEDIQEAARRWSCWQAGPQD